MNLSMTKPVKLWITVALCFGALSAALEARSTSSPPEVIGDQRSSPVADHSRFYGGLFYPHDERPSAAAAARDGLHGPGEEDDSIYLDQEAPREDGLAVDEEEEEEEARDGLAAVEQPKRSMGMLRLGRTLDKRPRSMAALRLGRRTAFEEEATGNKRSMGMLRLGRRAPTAGDFDGEEEEGKRSMGMLRLGRSQEGLRRRASLGR